MRQNNYEIIHSICQKVFQSPAQPDSIASVSGGDISAAFCFSLVQEDFFSTHFTNNATKEFSDNKKHRFFIKIDASAGKNAAQKKDFFQAEQFGLHTLAQKSTQFQIPFVYESGVLTHGGQSIGFIVMDFVDSASRGVGFADDLARGLAEIHQVNTQTGNEKFFGLDHSSYCGATWQPNQRHSNWLEFFRDQRLVYQMDLLKQNKLSDASLEKDIEALYQKMPDIVPSYPMPSLLHGDLWSGNVITDNQGKPTLIDPSIYYGHNEADIAFTQLFGGFGQQFYQVYQEYFPQDNQTPERFDLYNIYHLLNHANLFASLSYKNQAHQMIKKFL